MDKKTGRIQRNSISRDQAFDVFADLQKYLRTIDENTVEYHSETSDRSLAKASDVTEAAVKKIRQKRFGHLADEMTSPGAKASARNSRLEVLEKKVERLIDWANRVEGEVNKGRLAEAVAKVEPLLFNEDAA